MSASGCIFCRIISGEIPCTRILETAEILALLDVAPLAPGHTLVVPKTHYENLMDVPPDMLGRVVQPLPQLAKAIMRATGATGLNLLQNTGASSGQAVFHLHFHLIPRRSGDELGYRWNAGQYLAGQADAMQARILEALQLG